MRPGPAKAPLGMRPGPAQIKNRNDTYSGNAQDQNPSQSYPVAYQKQDSTDHENCDRDNEQDVLLPDNVERRHFCLGLFVEQHRVYSLIDKYAGQKDSRD